MGCRTQVERVRLLPGRPGRPARRWYQGAHAEGLWDCESLENTLPHTASPTSTPTGTPINLPVPTTGKKEVTVLEFGA